MKIRIWKLVFCSTFAFRHWNLSLNFKKSTYFGFIYFDLVTMSATLWIFALKMFFNALPKARLEIDKQVKPSTSFWNERSRVEKRRNLERMNIVKDIYRFRILIWYSKNLSKWALEEFQDNSTEFTVVSYDQFLTWIETTIENSIRAVFIYDKFLDREMPSLWWADLPF